MLIPPLVLAVGALGLLARGHRRIIVVLALAAPILSIVAFAAQFVPGGVESCSSSTTGPSVCHAEPAITAWVGPLPFVIAAGLIVLSLGAIVSIWTNSPWPAAISAGLQAIPQVISFGGFVDWAPALAVTIAVAFAFAPSARTESRPTRSHP